MAKGKTSDVNRVSCHACRHFYVTWENDFPYGCKAMGFKGRIVPSVTVFESSGRACLAFDPKAKPS
ncbi:MAG: uracil-DNA glycosylase [Deltaproteobacteria bacterium]|nr:uracil-DNA glycosylase [Deltaproteobacteria bacterium]